METPSSNYVESKLDDPTCSASWRNIARCLAYALVHRRSLRCGADERGALKAYAIATMEAKDANCADEWWIGPWVDADLSKNDSFEPKGKHPDTIRLDWFLANMNKKGFDDIACGICSRDDIDAACGIPKNGITMQDISETMPPRVGFDI